MNEKTQQKIKSYEMLRTQVEKLKWELLDSGEDGVQPAIARIHGVSRQTVNGWANKRTERAKAERAKMGT